MKQIILLIPFLFSACSASEDLSAINYSEAYSLADQQWQSNNSNKQYTEYFNMWTGFNNQNKIDEKAGCYRYGNQLVKLVLIQNNEGVIERVVTSSNDKKTECFVKSYTGVKFPTPPISPFFHRMTMN